MTVRSTLAGRPWLQTARGLAWCADEPEAFDYDITEIAHALSHLGRFAGHTTTLYTVADHSVRVAAAVRGTPCIEAGCRAALLHDAAEAFLVDMPSPIKRLYELAGYRALMAKTEHAIAMHFGLVTWLNHDVIKWADLTLLATEKRDVLGPSPHDADWSVNLPDALPTTIVPRTPEQAKRDFLDAWVSYGGTL